MERKEKLSPRAEMKTDKEREGKEIQITDIVFILFYLL